MLSIGAGSADKKGLWDVEKPKTYQAAMARIRELEANFAGMLRQKLAEEKRAQLAERECEQYRETLVDNETYCESMMAVRDDAIARANAAEAALAESPYDGTRRACRLQIALDQTLIRAEQAEAALAAVPVVALEHYWTHSDWIPGSVDREQEAAGDAVISAWLATLPQPEVQP